MRRKITFFFVFSIFASIYEAVPLIELGPIGPAPRIECSVFLIWGRGIRDEPYAHLEDFTADHHLHQYLLIHGSSRIRSLQVPDTAIHR